VVWVLAFYYFWSVLGGLGTRLLLFCSVLGCLDARPWLFPSVLGGCGARLVLFLERVRWFWHSPFVIFEAC
jgi:hypothetical protein